MGDDLIPLPATPEQMSESAEAYIVARYGSWEEAMRRIAREELTAAFVQARHRGRRNP